MVERYPFPGEGPNPRPRQFHPMIRGPFVRNDSIVVAVYKLPWQAVEVEFDYTGPQYKDWEVALIGEHDYEQGLDRIAFGYWQADAAEVRPGTTRLFQAILNAAMQ